MTSAEPCRKAPYSLDLQWRVIWQRIGMELSYRKIAANLSISVGTAYNVFKVFYHSGDVNPKKQPERKGQRILNHYDEMFVIGLIIDSPSTYLSELCQAIEDVSGKRIYLCP